VEAFRKMKAALGVQMAEELFTGFGLRGQASEECVDVFVDGFAIRLFLHSQRCGIGWSWGNHMIREVYVQEGNHASLVAQFSQCFSCIVIIRSRPFAE